MCVLSRYVCVVTAISLSGTSCVDAEDGASQAFALRGKAQPVCSFQPAQARQASNMAVAASSGAQNVLSVTQLTDLNAKLTSASITVTLKGMCNHPHTMTVSSKNGGLVPLIKTEASSEFIQHIDYSASISWASSVSVLQTEGVQGQTSPSVVAPGAVSGDLRLDISIASANAADAPVVAGTFTDNLVIVFTPLL